MEQLTQRVFELEPIVKKGRDPHRSGLIVDGEPTGAVVRGIAFEAALTMDRGLLLITSYACPHEELLEFYLLDDRWRPLDHLTLGLPYASGILADLRQVSGSEARFHFFLDDDAWTIRVGKPRWRLHPWAATCAHFLGPVARPFPRLVGRSMLRIEGEYLAHHGGRVRVRG